MPRVQRDDPGSDGAHRGVAAGRAGPTPTLASGVLGQQRPPPTRALSQARVASVEGRCGNPGVRRDHELRPVGLVLGVDLADAHQPNPLAPPIGRCHRENPVRRE